MSQFEGMRPSVGRLAKAYRSILINGSTGVHMRAGAVTLKMWADADWNVYAKSNPAASHGHGRHACIGSVP